MYDKGLLERKVNNKFYIQIIVASILMGAAFAISIGVGRYPISMKEIIKIIMGQEVTEMTRRVFFSLRLPRTIMVLIAGMGLSISVYIKLYLKTH